MPFNSTTNDTFVARYGPWAVVTGASSGIGREFARALAQRGLNVILVARRAALLEQLARQLRYTYLVQARVIAIDLRISDSTEKISEAVSDVEVGLVACCAGAAVYGSFFKDDITQHSDVITTNVLSPVTLTRLLAAPMRARRRGAILLVGSAASSLIPYFAVYSPSKRFLAGFAQLLRFELQPFNVDVLCVEPGLVRDTTMADTMCQSIDFSRIAPPTMHAADVAQLSLKQLGVRALYTPGVRVRLSQLFSCLMPTSVRLPVLAKQLRDIMSPKMVAGLGLD